MTQDRRTFLATLGAGALGLVGCRSVASAAGQLAGQRRVSRVGIQLYTLRRQASADLAGTLAELAKIGFKEIEFAGYYGKPVAEVRRMLDANGLTSPSTHLGLDVIMANPQKAFDDAKTLGQTWLTVPSLPSGPKATVDDWKRIAGQFNTAAQQARAAGLRFAFHNHNAEFRKIGTVVPYDVLLDNTDPALVEYQLDIHWMVAGGGDPLEYIRRYPKRFPMVHVKDSAGPPDHRQTELGHGTIPFAKIFAQRDQAGIKHWFIEHDSPQDPMAFARNGYAYLSTLTF